MEDECKAALHMKKTKEMLLDFLIESIHKFAKDQELTVSFRDATDFINDWVEEHFKD